MNQNFQPGMHPDADQLSVFVERAATARERERMLAHLAECRECRDAVFLMQRPMEAPVAAKEEFTKWWWQRWLVPIGLTGAVLACGLAAVLIYVRPPSRVPESARQNTEAPAPEIAASDKTFVPTGNAGLAAQREKTESGAGRAAVAMNAVQQKAAATAGPAAPNAENFSAGLVARTPSEEAALPPSSVSVSAGAPPALATDAPSEPGLNSGAIPVKGRNFTTLQPLAAPPGVGAGISGRVTDATGAVIPQATVALRDAAGTTRQTATGADGSFQLTGVPAGHYALTVTSPGFASKNQTIDLKASELAMLQPVLDVGSVTQTVEVTASAAHVETDSAFVDSVTSKLPSHLPVTATASLGKRILSLDSAGGLFLSRNAGKSWKKVHSQWTGNAVRIELTSAGAGEAKRKIGASGPETVPSVFQLTTDGGAQWTSKDGTHWRPE